MYIAKIFCPVFSLGPGSRLAIWVQGCGKSCKNCISPELAAKNNKKEILIGTLCKIVSDIYNEVSFEGVTISGGEPLNQTSELLRLLEFLKNYTSDILVYTGYTWSEIEKRFDSMTCNKLQRLISVLIDGPYIEEQNTPGLPLRGSDNQNILFFDSSLQEKYGTYMKQGRLLQNIYADNSMNIIGITDCKYDKKLSVYKN